MYIDFFQRVLGELAWADPGAWRSGRSGAEELYALLKDNQLTTLFRKTYADLGSVSGGLGVFPWWCHRVPVDLLACATLS